jgi:hypothetical protein
MLHAGNDDLMSYAAEAPISAEYGSKDCFSETELKDVRTLQARDHFVLFRQEIRPYMIKGWWTQEVAWQLQRFYNEMVAGLRPKLAISAPPQHGKSWAATDFIAYVAGKLPDKKTIFGSYSDDLGVRTNNDLQRIITSERFREIFPGTRIADETSTGFDRWKRNSSLIEFIGHQGSFRNTTVSGQINGLELHLGVIDDPIKGREEAHRVNARNKAWEWFADDFMSRFAKDAALLVVMTRWHTDDILGRFMERYPELRMLSYPAIAEHDERHRRKGEPLFPELKPLDFLLDRKRWRWPIPDREAEGYAVLRHVEDHEHDSLLGQSRKRQRGCSVYCWRANAHDEGRQLRDLACRPRSVVGA